MRMGQFRHRVTIERPTETQGTSGGISVSWSEFKTVWAAVEPLSGRELFAAEQVQSNVSTRIRIRHLPGINEKMRVKHVIDSQTNYYDIEAVIPVNEARKETHLLCVKRGAEGFRSGQ